jgi:hypothetical protein
MPPKGNHFWTHMLASMRVGFIIQGVFEQFPIASVDFCANLSAHIFLSDAADDGIYNLTTDSPFSSADFAGITREFEFPCRVVSFEEWRDRVFGTGDAEVTNMKPFRRMYEYQTPGSQELNVQQFLKELEQVDTSDFSAKFKKNCPGISENMMGTKELVRTLLRVNFRQN